MQSMDPAPFLAHIISQTKQNIEFLIAHQQIPQDDGRDILARLSRSPPETALATLARQTENLSIAPTQSNTTPSTTIGSGQGSTSTYDTVDDAPRQPSNVSIPIALFQARAAWGYNENQESPEDLTFRAGDIIDVLAETNADWWSGRHRGRTGLFPSNYVERLPPQQQQQQQPAASAATGTLPSPAQTPYSEKVPRYYGTATAPEYISSYTPSSGYQGPPPPGHGYVPYHVPPPPGGPPAVQTAPVGNDTDGPKQDKFGGKFGNTLAHSAVGGVGFGAGSAIGSGLVNSIF